MLFNETFSEQIEALKSKLDGEKLLSDKDEIVKELALRIKKAVEKVDGKIAIAFSGGVDSTLLALVCSQLNKDFILYSVGLQGSTDLDQAMSVAVKYGWKLKMKIISIQEAERIIENVVAILPNVDVVSVGVGAVTYAVAEMAKEDKREIVMTGLGSEELYAGYERHAKSSDVHEECWKGLKGMYERDLLRDLPIVESFGLEASAPLLDDDVIEYSMLIDPKLKINDEVKKIIIRDVAVYLGLDEEFAFRKKKAAQYGSSFDKALAKLTKREGFDYKKDYLEGLSGSFIN